MALSGTAIAAGAFLLSLWLTGQIRRYALRRQLLDVPNLRSSHSVTTPRGGGMAIVAATLAAAAAAAAVGLLPWQLFCALSGGGALVGGVGFVEDHREIARRWRLLAHFIAAIWVVVWVGGLPPLPVAGRVLDFGWFGYPVAVFYVVWLVNLTNFMDGIDGIAGVEVVFVCVSASILHLAANLSAADALLPLLLAGSTLGFLLWNWPPAKIFMGDGGSGSLGLWLATLSLFAGSTLPRLWWTWLILLAVFVVDATVTLLRRTIAGARVYEAHRTHAYQHAAIRWGAHLPVTLTVTAINIVWLFPVALLVTNQYLDGLLGALIASLPLVAIALWFGAGRSAAK